MSGANNKPNKSNQELDEKEWQLQEFVRELTASQGRIHAFIISLMPGSADVYDVLQETNLTLWKSRDRFQPGTKFLAWAFTVAKLEVYHQRDRLKRLGRIVLSEKLTEMVAEEFQDHAPDDAYVTALHFCMGKLTGSQREMIEARYQPGQSLEIHARITGRNASALRVALMRIRNSLKKCIEKNLQNKLA